MNRKKWNQKAIAPLIIAAAIAIVIVGVVAGLYLAYSSQEYPGCKFIGGANEANAAGVIDVSLVAVRHYNYMGAVNSLDLTVEGKYDQITPSELENYGQSFSEWIGGIMPGEAIEASVIGEYTFEIESGGKVIYTVTSEMVFSDYAGGDVSDTIGRATMPTLIVPHGTFLITYTVTLGSLTETYMTTWTA